jgi:hypothetical protein
LRIEAIKQVPSVTRKLNKRSSMEPIEVDSDLFKMIEVDSDLFKISKERVKTHGRNTHFMGYSVRHQGNLV